MPRAVNAPEARVRFGGLLHQVTAHNEIVVVERAGVPQGVVMSVADYQPLAARQAAGDWRERVWAVRQRVRAELPESAMPLPEEIIRRSREERDERVTDLR